MLVTGKAVFVQVNPRSSETKIHVCEVVLVDNAANIFDPSAETAAPPKWVGPHGGLFVVENQVFPKLVEIQGRVVDGRVQTILPSADMPMDP
jgi:hypothetical protein